MEELMARIEWKNSFSVGIGEIDEQHKRLLEMINGFSEAKAQPSHDKGLFGFLNELVKYADSHFTTEERYLEKHNFPDYPSHKEEHNAFTEEIFALNERLAKVDSEALSEITNFLKDWYISHVLGTDRGYVDFLKEKLSSSENQQ